MWVVKVQGCASKKERKESRVQRKPRQSPVTKNTRRGAENDTKHEHQGRHEKIITRQLEGDKESGDRPKMNKPFNKHALSITTPRFEGEVFENQLLNFQGIISFDSLGHDQFL